MESLLLRNRCERQAEWGEGNRQEETQRHSQCPEAEGGEATTGEAGTQCWAQTKDTFGNPDVADEGTQLKDLSNGQGSKISDFYLKLFTRCIRLAVCRASSLYSSLKCAKTLPVRVVSCIKAGKGTK